MLMQENFMDVCTNFSAHQAPLPQKLKYLKEEGHNKKLEGIVVQTKMLLNNNHFTTS